MTMLNTDLEIVLVSSGHQALDHRIYYKEARSLAGAFPRVRVVAMHPADEVRDGVRISALRPGGSRAARFLARPLAAYRAARGQGPRLLVLQDAELLPLAPLVRWLTGWHIVYDVHEDFSQLLARRRWLPGPLRRAIGAAVGWGEKLCSRACDGIIGVTQVLTDYFAHARRLAVYNLPSLDFIEHAAAEARPLEARDYDVVHLGTLSEERLEFLCEVLDALFVSRPTARALIMGVRPDQQALLSQRYPDGRVTVMAKVPYDRVAGYLGNCRVGIDVHPVLYPHLRCAVPVKVFEYMAAGCNVVTSHLPELHRLLGEEGEEQVVTITTAEAGRFAAEIARLLAEPASMVRRQQALMRLVRERWNWEHEAEKLVTFIEEITRADGVQGEPSDTPATQTTGKDA